MKPLHWWELSVSIFSSLVRILHLVPQLSFAIFVFVSYLLLVSSNLKLSSLLAQRVSLTTLVTWNFCSSHFDLKLASISVHNLSFWGGLPTGIKYRELFSQSIWCGHLHAALNYSVSLSMPTWKNLFCSSWVLVVLTSYAPYFLVIWFFSIKTSLLIVGIVGLLIVDQYPLIQIR